MLMQHQIEERIFIVYLIFVGLFLLFGPIVNVFHIETWKTETMLLRNSVFFKSFFVMLVAFCVLVWRNMVPKMRNIITLLLWFKENPFLLNFWMLWIILTSYIGIGEGTQAAKTITTSISLTSWYYITLFLLLGWLVYTLYLTFQQAKLNKKNIHIHIHEQEKPLIEEKEDWLHSLFDKIKQEHKKIGE